jgi:hypothetical protein
MRKPKHLFSVEMNSKKHVKNVHISDCTHERVFFEGELGELISLTLVDGIMLEIAGKNGILRTEISEKLLQSLLNDPKRELCLCSDLESIKNSNKIGAHRGEF